MKHYKKITASGSEITVDVWVDAENITLPTLKYLRTDIDYLCHCQQKVCYIAAKTLMNIYPDIAKIEISTSKGGEVYLSEEE